jgi:ketosteroid isomerase-like protein
MKMIAMLSLLLALPALADDVADLRRLDRELVVATYTKDAAWFTKNMSDDYVLITSSGKVKPRAALITELGTPGLEMQPYEPAEVNVRLFGDTAVITGRIVQKYTYKDDRVEADIRYTDVWVRSAGAWKNVAGHASAVSIRKESAK